VSSLAGYLLDTNVLSEAVRSRPEAGVVRFLEETDSSLLYISVLTLGELRKGVAHKSLSDPKGADRLRLWVDEAEQEFSSRILEVDIEIANLWGEWSAGRTRPVIDTLLAATAHSHELTLVTRNMRDFEDLDVVLLNPWLP